MNIDLEWIPPADLSDKWALIKPGLNKVSEAGDHWIPEDVYLAIKTGQSYLHIGYDDHRYIGFIVTTPTKTWDADVLHIWCVYSEAHDLNLLKECMPIIQKWAENVNAKRVTFSSKRQGWLKVAERLGFKQSVINYEIEV